MKAWILRRALELGFDACRIGPAVAPQHADPFRQWLAEGCHGAMGYLERNSAKRLDPNLVLAGSKSLIVLAASYDSGSGIGADREEGRARGVVARYARHRDYHEILAEPLRTLTEELVAAGGAGTQALWYADTGPVLERDHAMRAGLGFIGKHTNLIGRNLGNWFFIGEILTNLVLPADEPERNRCGSCTRCLAACPTQAITAPFRLDARRCISYLTIEWKGSIPLELRKAMGARIFGCDDCLEACPWNRFARIGRLMAPHRREDLASPELVAWLDLDEAGFRRMFQGTPMWRTKRRGLLRNVCVALGNIGGVDALPALERAARDAESLVAEHALWAIEEIGRRHGLSSCPASPEVAKLGASGNAESHDGDVPVPEGRGAAGGGADRL